jgi:DNA-binding GntR family transcriptional regulator
MMTNAGGASVPKYLRVAAAIRRQIADGTLRRGQPAPSGAELSRAFGFSTLTCRKALRALIAEGLLVPGPSRNARPRVADPQAPDLERDLADVTRALSAGLAARRHAAGLTQAELAALAGVSVTTVGHAETGRTWQSRRFWERADTALRAAGDLLRLHDAYRAASSPTARHTRPAHGPAARPDQPAPSFRIGPVQRAPAELGPSPTAASPAGAPEVGALHVQRCQAGPSQARAAHAAPAQPGSAEDARAPAGPPLIGPSRIVIVWTDGTVTTVHAPEVFARPPEPTFPDLER